MPEAAAPVPPAGRPAGRRLWGALAVAALGCAGCAQAPQTQQLAAGHGKEYFPSSVYGPASRRVVEDGQPIPRGGGQYLVGKPYTVAGQTYYPSERAVRQVGLASWYGDAFHGRLTANGEVYDRDGFTAAHPTMPLPSYARITNLRNNYSMVVRVNDRGPYHAGRIMDVSRRVAEALDFQRGGTAKIKVEYVGHASLAGSDDGKLYATLRRDGTAGPAERSLLAEAAGTPERVAAVEPIAATRHDGEMARGAEAYAPRRGRGDNSGEAGGRNAHAEPRREARRERDAEPAEPSDRHAPRPRGMVATPADGRGPAEGRHGIRVAATEAGGAGRLRGDEDRGAGRGGEHTDRLPRAERVARAGRGEERGAVLPPPRPAAHARGTDGDRGGEPMPPRRLRVASAEPPRRGAAGTHLTRSPND